MICIFLEQFKKLITCFFVGILVVVGCNKNEYVEIEPDYIIKSDNLVLNGQYIYPSIKLSFDIDFNSDSRNFYQSIDTTVTYKGYREKMSYQQKQSEGWCLLDWRIKSINVITLVDFDASHPEGSSVNDLLGISYHYKFKEIDIPLVDFKYGDLMLGDYYPYSDDVFQTEHSLCLHFLEQGRTWLEDNTYEVQIEDAFGRTVTLK